MTAAEPVELAGLKAAVLRTVVPGLVLALTAALVRAHLVLPNELVTDVVAGIVGALVTSGYYLGVRVLEHAKSSRWGWLLGYPSAPIYPAELDAGGKHAAIETLKGTQ